MRVFITFLCVFMIMTGAGAAHAVEQRLKVSEVHEFLADMNYAINNPTWNKGQAFLNQAISGNAVFESEVSTPGLNYWPHGTMVNNSMYYPYYAYRYPYAHTSYIKTGFNVLNKWEMISSMERKKQIIPGYEGRMELTEVNMPANALSAVVDVDFKEYSLAYGPYAPQFAHQRLAAFSKCKLYLSKHNYEVFLSRMDCNTNANMPL